MSCHLLKFGSSNNFINTKENLIRLIHSKKENLLQVLR